MSLCGATHSEPKHFEILKTPEHELLMCKRLQCCASLWNMQCIYLLLNRSLCNLILTLSHITVLVLFVLIVQLTDTPKTAQKGLDHYAYINDFCMNNHTHIYLRKCKCLVIPVICYIKSEDCWKPVQPVSV